MAYPLGEDGKPSRDQRAFINDFYQEEFEENLSNSQSTKRHRVPRRKIHAALSRSSPFNPSDTQDMQRTLLQSFSGYVHGAYPHIMELYGGRSPKYHMRGMAESAQRQKECEFQMVNNLFRALVAVEILARRCDRSDMVRTLLRLNIRLMEETDVIGEDNFNQVKKRLEEPESKAN